MGVVVFGLVVPVAEIYSPYPMRYLFEVSNILVISNEMPVLGK